MTIDTKQLAALSQLSHGHCTGAVPLSSLFDLDLIRANEDPFKLPSISTKGKAVLKNWSTK